MYCTHCGAVIPDGAKFCTRCGAKVESAAKGNVQPEEVSAKGSVPPGTAAARAAQAPPKKHRVLKILGTLGRAVIAIVVLLLIIGYVLDGPVRSVKNSTMNGYPGKTVGEAFDSYFDNPEWSSYKNDGMQYVEFSGTFDNSGDESTVDVIFLVDEDTAQIESFYVDGLDLCQMSDLGALSMLGMLEAIYE